MTRRTPLWIAVIWLATVAGAATLTWTVISAAGTQVGQIPPVDPGISISVTTPGGATSKASAAASRTPTTVATSTSAKPATPTDPTGKPSSYVGSWSGAPGRVIARCTGSAVSLVSAIPNDGYRVQTEYEGTKQLVVEFESAEEHGEDEGDEAHLLVSCSQSHPVFRNH